MFELKDGRGNDNTHKNTIIRIDGFCRFVEFAQAFEIGKIKLAFRQYNDKTKTGNSKVTNQIDCYMNIDEAANLGDMLVGPRLKELAVRNEKTRVNGNYKYAQACYTDYSGTTKNGKVISRKLTITMKATDDPNYEKIPFTLIAEEGPGVQTNTGAFSPTANYKEQRKYIVIGLTFDDLRKIGIQLKRAVDIYDYWIASNTLSARVAELSAAPSRQNKTQYQKQDMRAIEEQQSYADYSYNEYAAEPVPPVMQENVQQPYQNTSSPSIEDVMSDIPQPYQNASSPSNDNVMYSAYAEEEAFMRQNRRNQGEQLQMDSVNSYGMHGSGGIKGSVKVSHNSSGEAVLPQRMF